MPRLPRGSYFSQQMAHNKSCFRLLGERHVVRVIVNPWCLRCLRCLRCLNVLNRPLSPELRFIAEESAL
jgi:hypothetical protein